MDRLSAVLDVASFDDVVDATTFHIDPEARSETVMAVRDKVIGMPSNPSFTAIALTWLAGFDCEIKMIVGITKGA